MSRNDHRSVLHRFRRGLAADQRGHLMAGLMVAIAIMMIFSTVAFQAWADLLHRDNEAEMMFRAQEIVRAIQRYRKDHGGMGPPKLADLLEAGPKGQYYIRRMYDDPLTKDGKWGLLYIGPGGAIVDPNAVEAEQQGLGLGGAGGFGGIQQGGGMQQAGQSGGLGGSKAGGLSSSFEPLSSTSGPDEHAGGKTVAGLAIGGVKSLCEDQPFRVYNGRTEYRDWLFTYLDLEAKVPAGARPGVGGPAVNPRDLTGGGRGPGAGPGSTGGKFGGAGKGPGARRGNPSGNPRDRSGANPSRQNPQYNPRRP